jgi:hypothetical protein
MASGPYAALGRVNKSNDLDAMTSVLRPRYLCQTDSLMGAFSYIITSMLRPSAYPTPTANRHDDRGYGTTG